MKFPCATHRVIACESEEKAKVALAAATSVLSNLGVRINPKKTRIAHIRWGFEFLGYKIKRGGQLYLPPDKVKSGVRSGGVYIYPREKSIQRFKEQIRKRTSRKAPVTTDGLVQDINPLIRGWGEYYKWAHVRRLFHRLDGWIVRRIWSHKYKRWRCRGWKTLPSSKLYGEYGLVNLVGLIPSIASRSNAPS